MAVRLGINTQLTLPEFSAIAQGSPPARFPSPRRLLSRERPWAFLRAPLKARAKIVHPMGGVNRGVDFTKDEIM